MNFKIHWYLNFILHVLWYQDYSILNHCFKIEILIKHFFFEYFWFWTFCRRWFLPRFLTASTSNRNTRFRIKCDANSASETRKNGLGNNYNRRLKERASRRRRWCTVGAIRMHVNRILGLKRKVWGGGRGVVWLFYCPI